MVPANTNPILTSVLTISAPTDLYFQSPNTINCEMADPGTSSGCINLTTDNVTLECSDRSVVFTQPAAQNVETFFFINTHKNIYIHDCKFDWNDVNQTNTSGFFTTIRSQAGSAGIRIYNNEFTRGGSAGINLRGSIRTWIEYNYFHDMGLGVAGDSALEGQPIEDTIDGTNPSSDCWIEHNEIDRFAQTAAACSQSSDVHINYNTIRGNEDFSIAPFSFDSGIDVTGDTNAEVIGNIIRNVCGANLDTEAYNSGEAIYTPSDIVVSGNLFYNTACAGSTDPLVDILGSGVSTSGQTQARNVTVTNNTFDGVHLNINAWDGLVLSGNTFRNIISTVISGVAVNISNEDSGDGVVMENFSIGPNTFFTDNATLITAISVGSSVTTPDACSFFGNTTSTGVTNDIVVNSGFPFTTCYVQRSNRAIGAFSGGNNSPVTMQSSGINDIAVAGVKVNRLDATNGTTLASTDFALSGWGTSPAVTVDFNSKDQGGTITITTGSGSPSANPTVTLTFHDGTWTLDPSPCAAWREDTSSPSAASTPWIRTALSATAVTWTFAGTPNTGVNYVLDWFCLGH